LAVISATINAVGGFIITDRMLKMFRRKPDDAGGEKPS
jgi:H+-translocating NAD(P) transhydrogenase subunit alpha